MSFSFPTEVISEGMVQAAVPRLKAFVKKPSDYGPSKAPVFYNPAMKLNRDLAVLALQAFQRFHGCELVVCEPMAGCGIRGLRLAKEVDRVKKVIINDINDEAVRLARFNIEKNQLGRKVSVKNEDANLLLSRFAKPRKRFDYIDIDPFGSPIPFLDSALRALRRNRLLALTATDLAPLCGVHFKACVRKYGGRPLRTGYCHELAIRLLSSALVRSAAKYDIGVKVLYSYSLRHYVRLYALISYGAKNADNGLENIGWIHHCFGCFHREATAGTFKLNRRLCPECGKKMETSGPLWIERIIDESFLACMERESGIKEFKNKKSIRKLLILAREEANAPITYYRIDKMCDKLGLPMPATKTVKSRLEGKNYKACLTHFNSHGLKTDAPAKVVKDAISGSF
ncbi:MAG: tRNA (guanine(10)-N(2))-dimethyltransferase [Candidatus Bathyarchaeota archaeon]|nr:MAG: tRNA (guanine(10)-N(2))-dimethyltransferase [Candidatus Bathyarchaeota archaeon]